MNATFRPIEEWPKPGFEPHRSRERSRFDSHWQATLDLLRYELARLGADAVVVKLALGDRDIRRDGYPKANARPDHPGVVIEWQIGEAWYRRAAEKYDRWQDNVRAIALTLEALHAVERWGAVSGEQYEGFRLELEAGTLGIGGEAGEATGRATTTMPVPPRRMTQAEALTFLSEASGLPGLRLFLPGGSHYNPGAHEENVRRAYRRAAKGLHPDTSDGDLEQFKKLQEARDVLLGRGS